MGEERARFRSRGFTAPNDEYACFIERGYAQAEPNTNIRYCENRVQ
jgi:hypothetical protein